MQAMPCLDKTKLTGTHKDRLSECAYRIFTKLQSTKEGRRMLREEIELYRKEQAERRLAKC